MPTISVIIPVYNVEQYLYRCVNSVLNQTYTDYEMILVDDGSPDNSPQICDEFAGKYDFIKVIHKENGGLSSARNAGLEIAQGSYVTFLDSDDFFHPKALAIMMEKLIETSADICVCDYKVVDSDVSDFPDISNVNVSHYSANEAVKEILTASKTWEFVSSCVKVYRREIFDEIRFPNGKLHEDNFTTWKCFLKAENVIKCHAQLYYIYKNQNGITRSPYSLRRLDALEAAEEMMESLKSVDDELWHLAVDDYINACQYTYLRVKNELKNKKVYNQIRRKMIYVIKEYGLMKPFNIDNYYNAYIIVRPIRAEMHFKKIALKNKLKKLRGCK